MGTGVSTQVLITGGAKLIGSRAARNLRDNLHEQVHRSGGRPADAEIELIQGDVRDRDVVARALQGVDVVVHLAAEVGVAQSMYEMERYVSVNDLGTAVLMRHLAHKPTERVDVASSMSIYGEGLYRNTSGRLHESVLRGASARVPGIRQRKMEASWSR
jgi:dTDP-L-rhamnose 4-epimerase